MNRRFSMLVAAGAAGAMALANPLGAAPAGTEDYNSSTIRATDTCGATDQHTLVISAPTALWPPNHKYFTKDLFVAATDGNPDPLKGDVELLTTGTHDQYDGDTADTENNGSGNTADDITVNPADEGANGAAITSEEGAAQVAATETAHATVQTLWQARAERAGTVKPARVYTLTGTANFADGSSCSASVDFAVPHDMSAANRGQK